MNCQVCYRHLTPRRACLGCRGGASNKPPPCRDCALKACAAERGVAFCAVLFPVSMQVYGGAGKDLSKALGDQPGGDWTPGRRGRGGGPSGRAAEAVALHLRRGDLPPRWSLLRVRAARGLGDMKLPDDPHTHVLAHLAGELVQQQVGRADGVVIAQQILVGGIAEQGGIVDKHAAP